MQLTKFTVVKKYFLNKNKMIDCHDNIEGGGGAGVAQCEVGTYHDYPVRSLMNVVGIPA